MILQHCICGVSFLAYAVFYLPTPTVPTPTHSFIQLRSPEFLLYTRPNVNRVVPPYLGFYSPVVTHSLEADDLPSDLSPESQQ